MKKKIFKLLTSFAGHNADSAQYVLSKLTISEIWSSVEPKIHYNVIMKILYCCVLALTINHKSEMPLFKKKSLDIFTSVIIHKSYIRDIHIIFFSFYHIHSIIMGPHTKSVPRTLSNVIVLLRLFYIYKYYFHIDGKGNYYTF